MSKFKFLIHLIAGALIYTLATILSTLIFPMSQELSTLPTGESWFSLPSLLIAGFIYSLVIYYLIKYSRKSGKKLLFQLTAVIIGVNVIMTQIETFYFQSAFPLITNREMAGLFIRGILIHLLYIPLFFKLSKIKSASGSKNFILSSSWWRYALSAIIYVPVYLGFGMIAQRSPALQAEYSEWMMKSSLIQMLPLWTLFRGVLWTLLAVLVSDMFDERKTAITSVILIFTVFVAVSLIHPSAIMSFELRLVHFFEIIGSMALYGFLAAKLVSKKN